jgi:hypothetical protein
MSAPTTIRDGMRWCTGHCGRLLPLSSYYRNGRGEPNTECKSCRRVSRRESWRRWIKRRGVRRLENARFRAMYHATRTA